MQRVRIGLTGLAFVFVLVLIAAVFSNATEEEPITANAIDQIVNNSAPPAPPEDAEPKEPLAKLGVAPGNADTSNQAAQPPGAANRPDQ